MLFSDVRRSVSTETEICEEMWKVQAEIGLKFRGKYGCHWTAFHKIRVCSKFLRDCCTEFYANSFLSTSTRCQKTSQKSSHYETMFMPVLEYTLPAVRILLKLLHLIRTEYHFRSFIFLMVDFSFVFSLETFQQNLHLKINILGLID